MDTPTTMKTTSIPVVEWAVPMSSYVVVDQEAVEEHKEQGQPAPSSTSSRLTRHIVPYEYTFEVHAKARWFESSLVEVFAKEFHPTTLEEYAQEVRDGKFSINDVVVTKTHKNVTGPTAKYLKEDDWPYRVAIRSCDKIGHHVVRVEEPVQADTPITILAIDEENGILAVSKPSEMPVHPSGRYHHNTVVGLLRKVFGFAPAEKKGKGGRKHQQEALASAPAVTHPNQRGEGFTFKDGAIVDRDGHVAVALSATLTTEHVEMIKARLVKGRHPTTGEESHPFLTMQDLHVVHRLDKSTSGVLLFAMSQDASRRVFAMLKDKSTSITNAVLECNGAEAIEDIIGEGGQRKRFKGEEDAQSPAGSKNDAEASSATEHIQKFYVAKVSGKLDTKALPLGEYKQFVIDGNVFAVVDRAMYCKNTLDNVYTWLSEAEQRNFVALHAPGYNNNSASNPRDAKAAVTLVRTLHHLSDANETVVECLPLTGRSHQIRVHLQLLGHPIVGDTKYGGPSLLPHMNVAGKKEQNDGEACAVSEQQRLALVEPASVCLHALRYVLPAPSSSVSTDEEAKNDNAHHEMTEGCAELVGARRVFETGMPPWAS